jgi:hypothetical protein
LDARKMDRERESRRDVSAGLELLNGLVVAGFEHGLRWNYMEDSGAAGGMKFVVFSELDGESDYAEKLDEVTRLMWDYGVCVESAHSRLFGKEKESILLRFSDLALLFYVFSGVDLVFSVADASWLGGCGRVTTFRILRADEEGQR